MSGLALTIVSQTAKTLKVSWVPPTGCVGYEFLRDDVRVSSTFNGAQNAATFSIPDGKPHTFTVAPLTSSGPESVTVNAPIPAPSGSRLTLIHYGGPSVATFKNLASYTTAILNLNSDGIAVPCRSLTYSDPTSIPTGYDDCVTYATAQANGWVLQVVGSTWGQIAVPDMRVAAYRTEFCQSAVRYTKAAGRDGMHCDNVGVYQPVGSDYPGFRDAMVALVHELGDAFRAAGLYLIANVNGYSSHQPDLGDQTNGDAWVNWAKMLQPGLTGFGCEFEYWGMPTNGDQRPRLRGPNWDQQWDAWQTTPKRIEALGMDFFGVTYGPTSLLDYGYASLLAASDKAQLVISLLDNTDPWGVVPASPTSWTVNPTSGTATVR